MTPPMLPVAGLSVAEHAVLQTEPWFAGLSGVEQQQLLQHGRRRSLVQQQQLFARGDAFCGIYVVLDGQLLISGLHPSGNEALLTLVTPGVWFGEIAWFDQKQRTHDAIALQDLQLWQLTPAALQQLVAADPLWWQRLGQLLTGKLRQLFVELEDRALLSAQQRLARWLCQLSQGGQFQIPLQQEQLGQLLSLSRQTTNLMLRQLVSAGCIETRYGKVVVLDRAALLRLAQA